MPRGSIVTYTERLVVECCCNCGISFAMPEDLKKACLEDHDKKFYCPNGHNMVYTGKTDEQKAIERAEAAERKVARTQALLDQEQAERKAARTQALLDQEQAERKAAERRERAQKAAATRARNRIEKGVCPHPKCHRHFENVQRHVARCHPDFAEVVAKPLALVP